MGEIRHAWCQMCGPARTMCSTLCRIEDGKWVGVEGNPIAGNNGGRCGRSLCAKGHAAPQILTDPARLAYPMRRVGAKGVGRAAFERCTWEEATEDIASRLSEIKQRFGAESLGILSPQFFPVLVTVGRRFLNVFGSPNYLHSGICALQRVASKTVSIGDAWCNPVHLDKTRLLVVWGSNCENSAVNQGGPAARLDAIERGTTVVDIRPMLDPLASKADIWLPVRPGTDGALALAFLNVIIGERLYDEAFVDEWCSGFDELADHVASFPPEWAAPITGIPADRIREVARLMGTVHPMGIQYGNGIGDQQRDGNWTCIAICLIEAITGNLDVCGGGEAFGPGFPPHVRLKGIDVLSDRLAKSAEDEANGWCAGASSLVAPETPRWYQNPSTWESGPNAAYYPALMSALSDDPHRIRAVIGQASNPLGATRQPKNIARALEALDLYVVHDTHWNPSCDYADYVLPACTHYECSHQIGVKGTPRGTLVGITQPLAAPLGESKSDWQFYLDLACALGYGDDFWNGDMDACLREQLEGTGITLEELRECGYVFVERDDADARPAPAQRRYEKLFARLPEGKVQCANGWIGGRENARGTGVLPRVPVYVGPPEGIAETPDVAETYPLVFSDVHAYRLCNHSYYVGTPYLRELQPYPWVKINPATARRYGIADGDWVRIESPHGWIVLTAECFEGIAPDVLMARRGWWQACEALGLPGYGCFDGGCEPSVLYDSDPENADPFHSATAKQTLVRIERWNGAAPVQSRSASWYTDERADESGVSSIAASRGFTIDASRCIGCQACIVACKQETGIASGTSARCRVSMRIEGTFPDVHATFLPAPCGRCFDPACAAACPTGAIVFSASQP